MRYHRSCALLHTLSRRSQLSVGSCGSMLHDRVLAPRPRPWAWRTFIALSCAMTGANAARKRSSLGLHKGGVFRPRSCVHSAGGGCPRTSPPLGFPGGFQRLRVPSPVFGSSRRAVLRASGALSQPSCLLPTGVSLSGRLSAGAYRVLDPVPISRRRVIV